MAVWAVGDIHGMIGPLRRLEERLGWSRRQDRLVLLGDLVGRGRDGLAVLRWAHQRRDWVRSLLGNHDMALLMAAAGLRPCKPETAPILAAADSRSLIDWLRRCPLLIEEEGWLLVHAGLLPAWSRQRARLHARAIEDALAGDGWQQALAPCWGNDQLAEDPSLPPESQLQLATNALCRMRWCDPEGGICLDYDDADLARLTPWYCHRLRQQPADPVICGHWSQHGLHLSRNLIMLDGGCVYGRPLAAWNLSDRRAAFA